MTTPERDEIAELCGWTTAISDTAWLDHSCVPTDLHTWDGLMPDPNTMTLDDCQDWLAAADGWKKLPDGDSPRWHWWKPGTVVSLDHYEHPFPDNLDAAAAALPKGWVCKLSVFAGKVDAYAWPTLDAFVSAVLVPSVNTEAIHTKGDSELLARFRLAVACRLHDASGGGGVCEKKGGDDGH